MATNNDDTHVIHQTTRHRTGMLLDLVTQAAASNSIRSARQRDRCREVTTENELELLHLMALASELIGLLPADVQDLMRAGHTYARAVEAIASETEVAA